MANGDWFIMTTHMLIQPRMSSSSWQEKENSATASTSISVWILIHAIYSCFQSFEIEVQRNRTEKFASCT